MMFMNDLKGQEEIMYSAVFALSEMTLLVRVYWLSANVYIVIFETVLLVHVHQGVTN